MASRGDLDGPRVDQRKACVACGHDPACGIASISTSDGTKWYCHTDDHDCYGHAVRVLAER